MHVVVSIGIILTHYSPDVTASTDTGCGRPEYCIFSIDQPEGMLLLSPLNAPREGCFLQFSGTAASGSPWVLYPLSPGSVGTELWRDQKKPWQPYTLCVNRIIEGWMYHWLQERKHSYSRVLRLRSRWPCFPSLPSFEIKQNQKNKSRVNMSRHDIQKSWVKVTAVKLTF